MKLEPNNFELELPGGRASMHAKGEEVKSELRAMCEKACVEIGGKECLQRFRRIRGQQKRYERERAKKLLSTQQEQ